ncbi:CU044_5270 family protein [Streptomyces europaeiscabiei]|uniref:CU044_5270 family protein n=1 Tax=Streptomyces europaeiscabiei TaxID=146819 RepID=A0AAJ2PN29_9ACTN|nr:CU044_5270 family protein [Streptomyces europaeiscabiei]MDX3130518.1 CU044_5270 family protein [Streptomyces europaeiscabiei]
MSGPPPRAQAQWGDDAEVVTQSLEQPELFARLYDRYAPDIHRYVARRLGDGMADDITADTFLTAFRIRGRYAQEIWTRYDGGATAHGWRSTKDGDIKLRITETKPGSPAEGDDRSPQELYRFLTTLPSEGGRALEAIREEDAIPAEEGSTRAEQDAVEISALLDADLKPSKGLAGLYRALATLPDLSLVDHLVKDATGRRVVALSEGTAADRYWLIDPETYDVLGTQHIRGGKVIGGNSLISRAVVDKAGERD